MASIGISTSIQSPSATITVPNRFDGSVATEVDHLVADGNPIPAGATEQPISLSFPIEKLALIWLWSSEDLLIETPAGESLQLFGGVEYRWHVRGYEDCKFTKDVTGLLVTNEHEIDVEFRARALIV